MRVTSSAGVGLLVLTAEQPLEEAQVKPVDRRARTLAKRVYPYTSRRKTTAVVIVMATMGRVIRERVVNPAGAGKALQEEIRIESLRMASLVFSPVTDLKVNM